jgi:hypothetical protein
VKRSLAKLLPHLAYAEAHFSSGGSTYAKSEEEEREAATLQEAQATQDGELCNLR